MPESASPSPAPYDAPESPWPPPATGPLEYPYPESDPDKVEPLRRFKGLFSKQPVLSACRAALKEQRKAAERRVHDVLAQDGQGEDGSRLFEQFRDGYQEQDRRAERAERRATTLLTSITIVTTIVGVTTAVLASSEILKHTGPRVVLGVVVFFTIVAFGCAARWALFVITTLDTWRRPSTPPMLENRAKHKQRNLYIHSLAALLDSIAWNQIIANYKLRRLHNASWFFGWGLTLLVLTLLAFPLLSTFSPAKHEPQIGPAGPTGAAGPPGATVQTKVRAVQVRAILPSRVLHARPGRRFQVRYALTHPSALQVVIERDRRRVAPIAVDTASYGAGTTVMRAPERGRYVLRLTARAANGTATTTQAPLLVR
jgi:hypothetical protein